jgi:hypothetical protein
MLQWLDTLREDASALAQDADSLTEDAAAESGITIEQVKDRFNFTSAHFPNFYAVLLLLDGYFRVASIASFVFVYGSHTFRYMLMDACVMGALYILWSTSSSHTDPGH